MAKYPYAFQGFNNETMARAMGRDLPISPKVAIEICNALRGKSTAAAKQFMQDVLEMKRPVPYKRFMNGIGHRRGACASGRYPQKASANILNLIESAEKNAQQKGINTSQLRIVHLCANRAPSPMHSGRIRGISMKRAHVEIVVAESKVGDGKKRRAKKDVEKKEQAGAGQKEPKKDSWQKEAKEGAKKEAKGTVSQKVSQKSHEQPHEKIKSAEGRKE